MLFKPVQSITALGTTAVSTLVPGMMALSPLAPGMMAPSTMALEQPIAIR